MLLNTADTCSNGITGVEESGVCCVLECGTCGGRGCGSRGRDFGLGGSDCCSRLIDEFGVLCSSAGTAPCIIDDGNKCGKGGLGSCRSMIISSPPHFGASKWRCDVELLDNIFHH